MAALRVLRIVVACAVLAAGTRWSVPQAPAKTHPGETVDINRATLAELRNLPGMGDGYARRIIRNRPYTAKNQLSTRGILPLAAYRQVAPFIVAHRIPVPARE